MKKLAWERCDNFLLRENLRGVKGEKCKNVIITNYIICEAQKETRYRKPSGEIQQV